MLNLTISRMYAISRHTSCTKGTKDTRRRIQGTIYEELNYFGGQRGYQPRPFNQYLNILTGATILKSSTSSAPTSSSPWEEQETFAQIYTYI